MLLKRTVSGVGRLTPGETRKQERGWVHRTEGLRVHSFASIVQTLCGLLSGIETNPEDLEKPSVRGHASGWTFHRQTRHFSRQTLSPGLSVLIRWDNPSIQLSAVFRLRWQTVLLSFAAAFPVILGKYVSGGGRSPLFQSG